MKFPTVERISTCIVAAGNATGATVPFFGTEGTGDHIGEFDTWNMVKGLEGEKDYLREKKSKRMNVPNLLSSGDTKCAALVAILKQLDTANYKLYALR